MGADGDDEVFSTTRKKISNRRKEANIRMERGILYDKKKKRGRKQSLSKGEEQKPASYIQKKAFWRTKIQTGGWTCTDRRRR